MTPEARVEKAARLLKVFPLPSAVLFPSTALPLHIFEPRYRAMVNDAIEGDKVIALADLRPGWEHDYAGRPPLQPIGCAGVLGWHEQLADGRFEIVLQGVMRFRVLEELPPTHLYREVRAELLPDPEYHGPLEELVRQAVLEIAGHIPDAESESLVQLAARAKGGALADVVAGTLISDVERRKMLLNELDPAARLSAVLDDLGELIARIGVSAAKGPLN